MRFMRNVNDGEVHINNGNVSAEDFFNAHEVGQAVDETAESPNWAKDFQEGQQSECTYNCILKLL